MAARRARVAATAERWEAACAAAEMAIDGSASSTRGCDGCVIGGSVYGGGDGERW
jgi:hypothetical protein